MEIKEGLSKRGMSAIVVVVVLVALALVAIGIVWVVVNNLVGESSDDITLEKLSLSLNLESAAVSGSNINVGVKRNPGKGDLVGLKFILSDGVTNEIIDKPTSMGELGEEVFVVTPSMNAANVQTVSVAAVYNVGGNEESGEIVDTILVGVGGSGGGGDGGGEMGNGIIDGDEECDDGNIDSGDGCSSTGTIEEGYECVGEPSVCTGGTCTNGETQLCALQEGVCALSEQTCVGEEWPGCDSDDYLAYNSSYETIETSCTDTFDNDCDGLTDNEEDGCELTFVGTVNSPWPDETKLFFIIEETDAYFTEINHAGRYIDFGSEGGGTEVRCIQMFDYVLPRESPLNKTIVKLTELQVPFGIASGDSLTIYEKTACGTLL